MWKLAAEHAIERRKQGITLEAVVREYQYLRDEIWQALAGNMPADQMSAKDVFVLGERLNYALDNLLLTTVKAYTAG